MPASHVQILKPLSDFTELVDQPLMNIRIGFLFEQPATTPECQRRVFHEATNEFRNTGADVIHRITSSPDADRRAYSLPDYSVTVRQH